MTRRYSDREVALILQRALEPGEGGQDEHSLTLAQIQEIAAEVGIDPARVEVAAALLESPAAESNPYAGIPTTLQLHTTLPEVVPSDIPRHDVLTLIRGTLGRQGIVGGDDETLEWKARDPGGGRYVTLTPSPEGLRVHTLGNYRDGLGIAMMGVGMAFFTASALVLDGLGLESGLTLAAAALLSLIPPRFAYRWWRKKEDATMSTLHQRLVGLLQGAARSHGSGDEAPRLDSGDPSDG
jgi:hypothetical protein